MKNTAIIATVLGLFFCIDSYSQTVNRIEPGETIPEGVVVYSLPSTSLLLSVEAVCESFTPGPYAEYAKKYLGIDVPQKEFSEYSLKSIKVSPYIEADRRNSYIANLSGFTGKSAPASFLRFSSQGLLVFSDSYTGQDAHWRFPSIATPNGLISSEATENLTSAETTLYRTVKNEKGGYDRIAVKQSSMVIKSPEAKAKEAAAMILSLREQRLNIITGNTDATFSGDALRAAVEEITKLENEYMTLFTGVYSHSVQKMDFDVVPGDMAGEELIIGFRISNTQGLLPADDISGRPVAIAITPENADLTPDSTDQTISEYDSNRKVLPRSKYEANTRGNIYYRIPSVCKVKITDGTQTLLQTRIPIYQKGIIMSFPISVLVQ